MKYQVFIVNEGKTQKCSKYFIINKLFLMKDVH